MKSSIVVAATMLLAATAGFAQTANYPKAKVSFDDFKGLVAEVEAGAHRLRSAVDERAVAGLAADSAVARAGRPGLRHGGCARGRRRCTGVFVFARLPSAGAHLHRWRDRVE